MPTEDNWRPANEWCENPEHWNADDDQATEQEITELVAAFVRALQPEVVVETGTWTGQTTRAIGIALLKNGHGHLYAVELDASRAAQARVLCTGRPVTIIEGDSLIWELPEGIGFAWIDGSNQRERETDRMIEKMLPGAIIGIHDTGPLHAPGRRDWLLANPRLRTITLRTPRGVSFAEVLLDERSRERDRD